MVRRFTKSFIILMAIFFAPVHTTAFAKENKNNAQEFFLRANKEYANKRFQKSHKLYSQIDPKGRAVWYNLGNCNYELKQFPEAIVCWRRAQRDASHKEKNDIEYNIAQAREQEGLHTGRSRWYTVLRASAAPFPFILLQLLLLFLWFGLFWLFFIYKGPKNIYFIIKLISLLIAVTWLSSILIIEYYEHRYEHAIMKTSSAVYAGPHDQYHVVGNLSSTDELEIHKKRTGWCKVKHEQVYGWVPVRTLISI